MGEKCRILTGNALEILGKGRSGFVQCAATSPPYWGLRDYHSNPQVWDGEEGCEHEWGDRLPEHHKGQVPQSKWKRNESVSDGQNAGAGQFCVKCDAWYGQLGLEPDAELYTDHLVQICRGVKRVLRDDGVFWLNLGDSYASGKTGSDTTKSGLEGGKRTQVEGGRRPSKIVGTLKPKDLVGIPWRVAFALQADGWYLRNAVVWHKPNCMPSSVRDRLTTCYEFVFFFSKSKKYYFDSDAIREPFAESTKTGQQFRDRKPGSAFVDGTPGRTPQSGGKNAMPNELGRNRRDVWTVTTRAAKWEFCCACNTLYETAEERKKIVKKGKLKICAECGSLDKWVDHFAMFPPDLIEPCILAGTSEVGCCPKCGAPWKRVQEKKRLEGSPIVTEHRKDLHGPTYSRHKTSIQGGQSLVGYETRTLGWEPSCSCGAEGDEPLPDPVPCMVLDPFCGAGTTGVVSVRHGRRFLGIDIKEEYAALSRARVNKGANG